MLSIRLRHAHDGDGQANALAVLAVGDTCFPNAPDGRIWENPIVGPAPKRDRSHLLLADNLRNIAMRWANRLAISGP